MNSRQAFQTLKVSSDSSFDEIKASYRKLALELHPDKNTTNGEEFKKVTEAYDYLKKNQGKNIQADNDSNWKYSATKTGRTKDFKRNSKNWGAPPGATPEEDWSRFTKEFESENPDFWKEYEKKFWEEYNDSVSAGPQRDEFEKTKEPKKQPDLFVAVDPSLCIGCCSCEMIAPEVFTVDKLSRMNPKSKVVNAKGAGINKIMNAAQTCPTKAIKVENNDTNEKLFPW